MRMSNTIGATLRDGRGEEVTMDKTRKTTMARKIAAGCMMFVGVVLLFTSSALLILFCIVPLGTTGWLSVALGGLFIVGLFFFARGFNAWGGNI